MLECWRLGSVGHQTRDTHVPYARFVGQRNLGLLFEGVPINDNQTLQEVGVRPRCSLILTKRPSPVLVDLPGENPNSTF